MPKGIYKRKKGVKSPSHYRVGHVPWNKGLKGFKEADEHYLWKGDGAGYTSVHDWVRKRLPKPELCVFCKQKKFLEMASKSHGYKRDLDDWIYLCRPCHRKYDEVSKDRTRDFKGRFI